MFTSIVAAILAVCRAIPIVNSWMSELMAAYVQHQIAAMKAANVAAIRKALMEQDQRDIEKAIGSPRAGEKSGDPNTEIRKDLPGVGPSKPKQ